MTTPIDLAIKRLTDLKDNPWSDRETINACIAELQDLQLIEQDEVETAYRWGFVDGIRYTNGTSLFYSNGRTYFENTYHKNHSK